jgi:hypothetical protein
MAIQFARQRLGSFGDFIDRFFYEPPRITTRTLIRRVKTLFYLWALLALFLLARLIDIAYPHLYSSYFGNMASLYYEEGNKEFFVTVATVAATLWVISVGILSFFRDAVPMSSTGTAPRFMRLVELVDARVKNYWILMCATVITGSFQTALYFSILSLVPWSQRWMISLSCLVAAAINASSYSFVSLYDERTHERLAFLETHLSQRYRRAQLYLSRTQSQGDIVSARQHHANLILTHVKSANTQLRQISAHQKYLASNLSVQFLRGSVIGVGVMTSCFAAFPSTTTAAPFVFALLLSGIYTAGKCIFTLVAFQTEVS